MIFCSFSSNTPVSLPKSVITEKSVRLRTGLFFSFLRFLVIDWLIHINGDNKKSKTFNILTVNGASFSQLLAPIVFGITSDKMRIASVITPAIRASQLINVRPNTVSELEPKIVEAVGPKRIVKNERREKSEDLKQMKSLLNEFMKQIKDSSESLVYFNNERKINSNYLNIRNQLFTKDIETKKILIDTKNIVDMGYTYNTSNYTVDIGSNGILEKSILKISSSTVDLALRCIVGISINIRV